MFHVSKSLKFETFLLLPLYVAKDITKRVKFDGLLEGNVFYTENYFNLLM